MENCLGYSINQPNSNYKLRDSFRMLKVIKNRFSRDNVAIGLLFLPKSGIFKELPQPNDLTLNWLNENLN